MAPRLYDAHNHLQDHRLAALRPDFESVLKRENILGAVVNGSTESDWPDVLGLSETHPEVIPSFGYHPWYVKERSPEWRRVLTSFLDKVPAAVGEVGLDRWIKDYDTAAQEEVFTSQLRLAAERDLPVSVHCLKAWGRLYDILRAEPRPSCGFLLHSYGGPKEMVQPLAELGAYFSFPGYFAHERKTRQREAFLEVPMDRLLIETDAPDQLLPDELSQHALSDPDSGKSVNHPANLGAVYRFVAGLRRLPLDDLSSQVEENFKRLFGRVMRHRV